MQILKRRHVKQKKIVTFTAAVKDKTDELKRKRSQIAYLEEHKLEKRLKRKKEKLEEVTSKNSALQEKVRVNSM